MDSKPMTYVPKGAFDLPPKPPSTEKPHLFSVGPWWFCRVGPHFYSGALTPKGAYAKYYFSVYRLLGP